MGGARYARWGVWNLFPSQVYSQGSTEGETLCCDHLEEEEMGDAGWGLGRVSVS